MSLRKLLVIVVIELTPNGVIDRYMTFDEYMSDKKIKEHTRENVCCKLIVYILLIKKERQVDFPFVHFYMLCFHLCLNAINNFLSFN